MTNFLGKEDDKVVVQESLSHRAGGQAAARLWFYRLMRERPKVWALFLRNYERLRRLPRRARRRLAGGLAGVALLLALSQAPVGAANINVVAGEVEVIDNNKCSLIEAIENADDTTNGQPHNDCVAGNPNGPDTINLPTNATFSLTNSVATYFGSATGLPRIDTSITIQGNGATIRRSNNAFLLRILAVGSSGDLTLNNTTISRGVAIKGGGIFVNRGELEINSGTLTENIAGYGGGLYNYNGLVNINDSMIFDNTAEGFLNCGCGGGLRNAGTMNVTGSHFLNNVAEEGGAISNGSSTVPTTGVLSVSNSIVSGNASLVGGGMYNSHGMYVINSTIIDNTASDGGGIFNYGVASISGSTLARNEAVDDGGGLINACCSTVTVTNSTLSGNIAGDDGGGAFIAFGTATFTNSTVTGNSADHGGGGLANYGYLTLTRTLVSGNQANVSAEIDNCALGDCRYFQAGYITADEFNLFGHSGLTNTQAFIGFTPGPTDVTATGNGAQPTPLNNILSTTLKNNGGPTKTHALVFNSPALDQAPNVDCNAAPVNGVDQRGQARNADANGSLTNQDCDIGAFERTLNQILVGPNGRLSILKYLGTSQSEFFIGPREGLPSSARLDAIDVPDPNRETAHMSFLRPTSVPGLGRVPAHDVVTYDGREFAFLFDGSDVGLTTAGENVDALSVLDGAVSPVGEECRAYLLISTKGAGSVTGPDGRALRFRGEDVLGFCALEIGAATRGVWHLAFDGSAEGLPANVLTNLAALDNGGAFFFMTNGSFRADGVNGQSGMIYRFDVDTGRISGPYWATSDVGLSEAVSGLSVSGDLLLEDRR